MDFWDFENFDNDDFMDEDSFELEENLEMDDPFDDDSELDNCNEPTEDESQNDVFTAKDAFILGGAIGWAYEEGLREQKRRKRKKFSDD